MFLFLDTETGGLDATKHSLLTIAADLVPNIHEEPIAHFDAAIAHDPYWIDPAALNVNHIHLNEHAAKASPAEEVWQSFRAWIILNNTRDEKITPIGWNIPFDLSFIHTQLCTKKQWFALGMSYHTLDVCALVEFLILKGTLPPRRRLVQVASDFGLNVDKAHDASYDNYLCRMVLRELIKL